MKMSFTDKSHIQSKRVYKLQGIQIKSKKTEGDLK